MALQIEKLPWPYTGMVHDIQSAIDGDSYYLAALGLLSYSEVLGRVSKKETLKMNYQELLEFELGYADTVRCVR
jgi:hypothetical protein